MTHFKSTSLALRLLFGAGALILASVALADAAQSKHALLQRASVYSYGGVVYDRVFSQAERPAVTRHALYALRHLATKQYAITDLESVYLGMFGPLSGFPTAINNHGRITYFDPCELCFPDDQVPSLVIDDTGHEYAALFPHEATFDGGMAIAYAISDVGSCAGFWDYYIGGVEGIRGSIAWEPDGEIWYFDGGDDGVALAINNSGVSVGQVNSPSGVFAAAFSRNPKTGAIVRRLLLPPKNTTWTGTATGISSSGVIVGYELMASGSGRAVLFAQAGGYARVLPLAPTGVSTSAQAINVHGDIVGNAGSQAFIYKNWRVTYLPRPLGEEAGNAVAYAINDSDEVVGDITTSTGRTAFLYVNGQSYDLNSLLPLNSGWHIQTAVGINNSGQIVGRGIDANNPTGGSYSMKP